MTIDRNRANRELLAFYSEAGVDIALREEPNDWLSAEEPAPSVAPEPAQPAAAPAQRPAPVSAPVQRAVPVPPPPDAAVMAAREAARSAASLDELRTILDRFEGCALKNGASRLVFADGTPGSRLMLVGDLVGHGTCSDGLAAPTANREERSPITDATYDKARRQCWPRAYVVGATGIEPVTPPV